jgi:hypothetical protein
VTSDARWWRDARAAKVTSVVRGIGAAGLDGLSGAGGTALAVDRCAGGKTRVPRCRIPPTGTPSRPGGRVRSTGPLQTSGMRRRWRRVAATTVIEDRRTRGTSRHRLCGHCGKSTLNRRGHCSPAALPSIPWSGLSLGLAADLRATAVTVPAVSAGSTRARIRSATATLFSLEGTTELSARRLVGWLLQPGEVTAARCWRCLEQSFAAPAAVLHRDGGLTT